MDEPASLKLDSSAAIGEPVICGSMIFDYGCPQLSIEPIPYLTPAQAPPIHRCYCFTVAMRPAIVNVPVRLVASGFGATR